MLAMWFWPLTTRLCSSVWNASRIWPAVPVNSTTMRLSETLSTSKPCEASQPVTTSTSDWATPYVAANCAAVSHWW